MTSRSKEKMAAAFRKLFRKSKRVASAEEANSTESNNVSDSPAKRLLRHTVQPIDSTTSMQAYRKACGPQQKVELRSRRLMKEFKDLQRLETSSHGSPTFTVELENDNLFEWNVRIHRIDPESELAADMREHGVPYVFLRVNFPANYPFSPPFMRVISPIIEKGFVMEGGAICMELLTPRGWASAYTIEAVIMQFTASLVKGKGRIAKKSKSGKEFNRQAAEEAFKSIVKTHDKYGWVTPPLSDG